MRARLSPDKDEIKNTPTVVGYKGGYAPYGRRFRKRNANLQHTACARLSPDKDEIKNTPTVVGVFFMARPGGFEPSTYRFVAGHSIH